MGFVAVVVPPVGLHEHGVDLFEVNGLGLIANGFDERSDAEVFDGAQGAFGGAQDELDGILGEGGVGQGGEVELLMDVVGEGGWREQFEFGGVGDAAFDIELAAELEGGVEGGLADEDEVVVFGEVFEHEAQFVEGFDGQEVGIVDDGDEGFTAGVLGAGLGDEAVFATGVVAGGVEFEDLAEEAQEVGPGVQGAVDDGRDPLFGVVADDGVLEYGLAGAGFAEDEAEAALLGVDLEDVEVALLVFEQRGVVLDGEGGVADAEVGFDHGVCRLVWWLQADDFIRSDCPDPGGGRWRPCRGGRLRRGGRRPDRRWAGSGGPGGCGGW